MKYNYMILIILFPVIIIFSSFYFELHNLSFYDDEFVKYKIYDRFSKQQAIDAVVDIIRFLDHNDPLDNEFFKQEEISHLDDVRILINKIKIILLMSFLILISALGLSPKKDLKKQLFFSGVSTIFITALFGLFSYTMFDMLFLKFHELLFTGNYMFDPGISNMKALFPDKFFLDFVLRVIIDSLILSLILTLPYCIVKLNEKYRRRGHDKHEN